MYGQEVFGQLFLLTSILFVWTIYVTNRMVTYLFSNTFEQTNLLFYQWLTFLVTAGLIFLFFKIYKVAFLLGFYVSISFLTGIYFYLLLRKRQIVWLTKLEAHSVGLRIAVPFVIVFVIAGLFALIISGLLFRSI